MTDWIEHTGDTCPVDPETVVEVRIAGFLHPFAPEKAHWMRWENITHYRIVTPAKPPEPEMTKPEPDLIALRLECLKLAFEAVHVSHPDDWTKFADDLLHYVLNGSVDKA